MSYLNKEEKRKAIVRSVHLYMAQGLNKTAAVKKTSADFGYLTDIPVWNALKREEAESNGQQQP